MTNLADSTKLQGGVKKFEDFILQRSLVDFTEFFRSFAFKMSTLSSFFLFTNINSNKKTESGSPFSGDTELQSYTLCRSWDN